MLRLFVPFLHFLKLQSKVLKLGSLGLIVSLAAGFAGAAGLACESLFTPVPAYVLELGRKFPEIEFVFVPLFC